MKKYGLLLLLLGLILAMPGCGFDDGGEDYTVAIIHATPTPEPTPTPEVTPTPEPTPIPEVEIVQTESGVNIEKKEGIYTTTADINMRADCSTDASVVTTIASGTQVTSTGVSDNGWIEIYYNETTGYISADYATAVQ